MLSWVKSRWRERRRAMLWRCEGLELLLRDAREKAAEQAGAYNATSERLADAQIEVTRLRGRLATLEREQAASAVPVTSAQSARLAELIEECGEVQRTAATVLQRGYLGDPEAKTWPGRVVLESEIGHVLAAVEMLQRFGDVRAREVSRWRSQRLMRRSAAEREAQQAQ